MHAWELVALVLGSIGAAAWGMIAAEAGVLRAQARRGAGARVVDVDPFARVAAPLVAAEDALGRWGIRADLLLLCSVLLLNVPWLLGLWSELAPYGSPMGPDADQNFLAAVSIETGDAALYGRDRFPLYPALVAWLAGGPATIDVVGTRLSQACALAIPVVAYALGRAWAGRVAAWSAAMLVFRLPGLADTGRQFTPYTLVALLDLVVALALVGLARGRTWAAVPLAVASAAAFTADPKQIPVALAAVGLGLGLLAVRAWRPLRRADGGPSDAGARSPGGVLLAAVLLLGAIPAANTLVRAAALPIFTVEHITSRVDLGLDVQAVHEDEGWAIGDGLSGLPASIARLTAVRATDARAGWLAPRARATLPLELPDTSVAWLLALPALPLLMRWRARPVLPFLALVPALGLAYGALHLHFQHRYFLASAVFLPVVAAAALRLAGGPAAAFVVALVALLHPASPYRGVGYGLRAEVPQDAEPWTGVEPSDWSDTRAAVATRIPDEVRVLDFAASRPWAVLAADSAYVQCTATQDTCNALLRDSKRPWVVLFPGERPSMLQPMAAMLGELPEGAPAPEQLGACWKLVHARPGNGGLYAWTCDADIEVPAFPKGPGAAP